MTCLISRWALALVQHTHEKPDANAFRLMDFRRLRLNSKRSQLLLRAIPFCSSPIACCDAS